MDYSGFDDLVVEVSDGVAVWRINRPERLNAMRTPTFYEIIELGHMLKADDDVLTVGLNRDDERDGTELGLFQNVIDDGQWHPYQWSLEDPALWGSALYDSGDGILGDSFTLDSIVFAGNQDSVVFLDDIFYQPPALGPPLPIIGDVDGDGFVGINDLNVILANWNQAVPKGDTSQGDLAGNGDGFVGIDDLNVVLGNWNAGTPPAGTTQFATPEPATSFWVAGLLLSLAGRKRFVNEK